MKHRLLFVLVAVAFAVSVVVVGCKKDDETVQPALNSDIPANPGGTAPATTINNLTSVGGTFSRTTGNESRIRFNLLGITNPVTGLRISLVAGSSFWLTEDNVVKGVRITTAGGGNTLTADVVFVVDNSGSMGQEADSIATKIIAFASFLQASGLSVQVGCVGHGYNSDGKVYGALNLTTAANLSAYLNRSTGLQRTVGFSGADSARFAGVAQSFGRGGGENSVVGVGFADSLFSWRSGANRVFVVFTDEPTQPGGHEYWSTDGLIARWNATKGSIHTVFSADTNRTWTRLSNERPWDLSIRTGGTYVFIPANAAGLDLTTLPVTGALATSALVEYLTSNPNGAHNVVVVVRDGATADGRREFLNITY